MCILWEFLFTEDQVVCILYDVMFTENKSFVYFVGSHVYGQSCVYSVGSQVY